jgi:hypothetical protein
MKIKVFSAFLILLQLLYCQDVITARTRPVLQQAEHWLVNFIS